MRIISKLFTTLFFFIFLFLNHVSYASYTRDINRELRESHWDTENNVCKVESLNFNPFTFKSEWNNDILWEFDNAICLTWLSTTGIILNVATQSVATSCVSTNITKISTGGLGGKLSYAANSINPFTIINHGLSLIECIATFNPTCCKAAALLTMSVGTVTASLATIYGTAKTVHGKAKICGHDWNVWQENQELGWILDSYDGSYSKQLYNEFKNGILKRDIEDKRYREYLYGGKEYKDNGDGKCKNPESWNSEKRKKILGYDDDDQRYYFKGSSLIPNYACYRFLLSGGTKEEKDSAQKSFECCNTRSQQMICIENGLEYHFCRSGSRCNVGGIWFDVFKSKRIKDHLCAKTYSVCPYNHNLGGGTEIANYCKEGAYPSEDGKKCVCKENSKSCDTRIQSGIMNYCQYLKHCIKMPEEISITAKKEPGDHISPACYNLKGDSQNVYGYSSELLPVNTKHFTAPIAQCFKETLENIFLNKVGTSKCIDPEEEPINGKYCQSGYIKKSGENLDTKSFFSIVQGYLKLTIKLLLVLAIILFGINILFTGELKKRKDILVFVLKIGLIMFFALGYAWQSTFFSNVYNTSTFLSSLVLDTYERNQEESKLDGCQFPRYNHNDKNEETRYKHPSYPEGTEYLSIWDTLDCKIAMAIGFSPEVSVPNILIMMVLGIFAPGLGILGVVYFMLLFFFFFCLVYIAIKALHIFVISLINLVILVYISPITITMSLFDKTKRIFDNWLRYLISFILFPLLLFAFLVLFLVIFDKFVIGSKISFNGDGKSYAKQMVCSEDSDGVYCSYYSIKEMKWVGFGKLTEISDNKIKVPSAKFLNFDSLLNIAKAVLIMFLSCKLVDSVITVVNRIMPGGIKTFRGSQPHMMTYKAMKVMRGIQKRGSRTMMNNALFKKGSITRGLGSRTLGAIRRKK